MCNVIDWPHLLVSIPLSCHCLGVTGAAPQHLERADAWERARLHSTALRFPVFFVSYLERSLNKTSPPVPPGRGLPLQSSIRERTRCRQQLPVPTQGLVLQGSRGWSHCWGWREGNGNLVRFTFILGEKRDRCSQIQCHFVETPLKSH